LVASCQVIPAEVRVGSRYGRIDVKIASAIRSPSAARGSVKNLEIMLKIDSGFSRTALKTAVMVQTII
jgi:hypothetical protein